MAWVTPVTASGVLHRLVPRRYGTVGLVVATLLVGMSLTPSLLPRPPVYQGLISGVVAVLGYGFAAFATGTVGALRNGLGRSHLGPGDRERTGHPAFRRLLLGQALVVLLATLALSDRWQEQSRRLVGEPQDPASTRAARAAEIALVAVAVFVSAVAAGRFLAAIWRWLTHGMARWIPRVVAGAVSAVLIGTVLAVCVSRIVEQGVLGSVDESFAVVNRGTRVGLVRPVSPLRSGGPGSLMAWSDLGAEGRRFVAGGPNLARLTAFSGRPAREPIRVYGGLGTDEDPHRLAARVVRELDRTGAFDRRVLCVALPTGSGWVDNKATAALEYMYDGDSAIVSMQYSYLPSPLAFLVDPARPQQAGRELFGQVYRRWLQVPPARRPRLLLYGESLGATGLQAAFGSLRQAERQVDGALFVGTPASSPLWRAAVTHRDRGSQMVLPVYGRGQHVRFAATRGDFADPRTPRGTPRIAFLQHASDPIVWWSPRLLVHRPDWLTEPRGSDVNPAMRWFPIVTFWQVTADMAVSNSPPLGHGHRYGEFAPAWSAIAGPPGWRAQDTTRLSAWLAARPHE